MQEFVESCWLNRRVKIGKSGQKQGSDGNTLLGCSDLQAETEQGHKENDRNILWSLVEFWVYFSGIKISIGSLVVDIAVHFAKNLSNEESSKGMQRICMIGDNSLTGIHVQSFRYQLRRAPPTFGHWLARIAAPARSALRAWLRGVFWNSPETLAAASPSYPSSPSWCERRAAHGLVRFSKGLRGIKGSNLSFRRCATMGIHP